MGIGIEACYSSGQGARGREGDRKLGHATALGREKEGEDRGVLQLQVERERKNQGELRFLGWEGGGEREMWPSRGHQN